MNGMNFELYSLLQTKKFNTNRSILAPQCFSSSTTSNININEPCHRIVIRALKIPFKSCLLFRSHLG